VRLEGERGPRGELLAGAEEPGLEGVAGVVEEDEAG